MTNLVSRIPPRTAVALALLAIAPVATFGLVKSMYLSAAVTLVNVTLISTSLYLLFSPHETDHEPHAAEA